MIYSAEVQHMCPVAKGAYHGPAPIPEEGKWVQAKEIKDISGLTHGIGWCAPQQGACKLTLNIKDGIIEEALVETIGCSGMTHSAFFQAEDGIRDWSVTGVQTCALPISCKLTLNVKNGVIEEALVETIGCSGMTQIGRASCRERV